MKCPICKKGTLLVMPVIAGDVHPVVCSNSKCLMTSDTFDNDGIPINFVDTYPDEKSSDPIGLECVVEDLKEFPLFKLQGSE